MIDKRLFDERVASLWESQKRMAAPKKFKSGKRAGLVRVEARLIEFTRAELSAFLWQKVGINAAHCDYCPAVIDILSLTLDHAIPRKIGGRFSLDNLHICCVECNQRKGDLTASAYLEVLRLSRSLSPYDGEALLKRLAAAHHGSPARFFRKPQETQPVLPPAAKQNALDYELGAF